ncbi:sugar ABC transporter ATP-binding protein [Halalkalibacter akibai]|uniref:Ribose ABC transport system n=1 Tax=Halalkalibacter akibai (strain ATCC 43226 / DSM 21942 / CIP 109018 / JCM 9157 / 1139) TaxID=1236973 RepID=W4QZF4_HALA3|nr:sugar ABC transporter ATP-binding protein [Halalkalibacter akibai]GAE37048.1 ribose ABC transport system [Halalkalibacter akibai JCM 9157]
MDKTILEMKKISIEFPGVKALDQVDFEAETGKSHALLGANGAGKSTLMKVLSGAYSHYTGEIFLNGKQIEIRSPKDAQEQGIQIVYQEVDTALVPSLSVGENIMLNDTVNEMGSKQFMRWKNLHNKATDILNKINIEVSSRKLVSELTLAEKQMVLIARAVSTQCKFLVLDEPTAPLSHAETTQLFKIVKKLKEDGVGIIFISHRLPEIFQICDEITVMRNGQFVIKEQTSATNSNKVIENMLGEKLEEQFPTYEFTIGHSLLKVKGLTDKEKVKNVSLEIKEGEIIGIAGLVGAGKTELCKALFGYSKLTAGTIELRGKELKLKTPYDAVREGIALVPEERRKEGVLISESVATNLSSASLQQFTTPLSFLKKKAEKQKAIEMIKRLGVKTPSEQSKVEHLSGGNQQKIAIGKWLIADAEVYIFDEPTKGVDVGAKKDIFELIVELAQRGKAIIYASAELAEVMGITNRVYVLYDGQIVKEVATDQTSEEQLLHYSTGGN